MKKTLTLTGSILALALAACGGTSESSQAAALGAGTNQVRGRGHDQRKAQMFADSDKNGDGSLDAAEVGADRWAHIAPADADKDGKITRSELDAARASGAIRGFQGGHGGGPPPSVDEVIAKHDTNKDGVLQTSEVPEHMKQWIGKVDTNGDGTITKEELEAARAAREARRAQQGK